MAHFSVKWNIERYPFVLMNIKKLIYIFLSLFSAVQLNAQIHISGKVTDSDNQAIEFATVRIAGTTIGATTGLDGTYSFSTAKQDTIEVIFSCIGYKEHRQKLIDPDANVSLNAKLHSSATELQDIVITEYKKQTDGMQNLDAGTLRLTPSASGNGVESLLATMAGVSSKNEMSSQYSVRGGSYDENSVYINGIEIYRPQLISSGQQEGLSIINPHLVGDIQFSTGGFSAEYGDKMSSVLDITYRQPEAFEGNVTASMMGAEASVGHSTGKFSQLHGIRYKRNTSLLSSLDSKGEYDPSYFDYQTSLKYKFNGHWDISFLGNISLNDYKFKPTTRTTSFGISENVKEFTVYFDGQEHDKFETFFGALELNHTFNKSTGFTLLASGFQTSELVSYDISGEYWLDEAGTNDGDHSVGGEIGVGKYLEHARNRLKATVFTLALKGHTSLHHHNLSYGMEYRRQSVYDRSNEWEMRDSAGYALPNLGNQIKMIYNLSSHNDLSTDKLSWHIQDTYRLLSGIGLFSFNGGIRMSYWNFNKEFLFSPRVSIGFIPEGNSRVALRLAGGLYYQSPFYKEFRVTGTDNNGNSFQTLNNKIKSQRSIQLIAGGDYTFRAMDRPFKLTAEAYYKNLANLIPYELDNLKLAYSGKNASSGFITGIDFKLFGQFVPGTDSWLSFSLMKTRENLNGVKVPRPTDQRYSIGLFLTDYFPKFPKLKFSLKGILSDGFPMTPPQVTRDVAWLRTPAYKRIDIGFQYQLVGGERDGVRPYNFWRHFKSIWIGLDVFNLLDISNVSSCYWVTDVNNLQYAVPNYLTGRQFNVNLSVSF